MVISAVLLKITHLPLTKSTFCYKYMWLEYVAYFLFRCMFYPEVPQFCHLKNGQWEYSQESWEHQLGQMQLCAELCLPWVASALPSPCTHRLLKNFWLHYEIWVLLLLISEGLCDGAGTFCCHIEQGSLLWACGGKVRGVYHSSTAVSGHSEDPDGNGRRCTGGSSLTSSSKSPLYSHAENQIRSIPHTPVLLLLSPGHWHRKMSAGLQQAFSLWLH